MKQCIAKPSLALLASIGLIAGTTMVQAQSRDHRDSQQSTIHHPQEHGSAATANELRQEQRQSQRPGDRQAEGRPEQRNDRRVASADQHDQMMRYRREHPRAAARCHDGFFTRTTDRRRACSKHGGIEIWLLE